jgi:tetratricopeptide (TPR) repeat protein
VNAPSKPFFLQALDALKAGDRRGAAALLERQLREGNTSAKNLPSVSQLAAHIGEIGLAIEASRQAVVPGSIPSLLAHWGTLASYGRSSEVLAEIERQPQSIREHPSVLHVRGTVATEFGRFDEAGELFRRALAKAPAMTASWLSLAMIKRFSGGDPDLLAMERLEPQIAGSPEALAPLLYAIGKAREDCGDIDRAFPSYARGAALRRQQGSFNVGAFHAAAGQVIRDFTAENLERLVPSAFEGGRSLFVTGLPRSGTTLTEQIILGHSAVVAGAEVNLFAPALIPTLGPGLAKAMAYQQRTGSTDPWGEIGADYARFIEMRFRSAGLIVDKSLSQSLLMGLLLHALPDARVAWLCRSPDDVALSCFRTFFSTGLDWTCSLQDIADYMRAEDRLFEHWRSTFGNRILVVPYEELVAEPASWARRLQLHFRLPVEPAIERASRADRPIGTASVGQVREAISTSRIGLAKAFERHLKPFRDRYYA